jgi:hypothetical protein
MPSRTPSYRALIEQLLAADRQVSRTNMRVTDYENARRVLSGLDREALASDRGNTHGRLKALRVLKRLQKSVDGVTESHLFHAAEQTLQTSWSERTNKRNPSTRMLAFTLTGFSPFHWESVRVELAKILPYWQVSGTERQRLLVASEWAYELFVDMWKQPDSIWRIVAEDVPDGTPVRGPGKPVEILDGDEIDGLKALWVDDPDSGFFQPQHVLETLRLL